MCLITFQSTRQSATPLSGSHHPENYSFILEQLELPVYTAIFPVFPSSPRPFPRLSASDAFLFLAFISLRSSATSMLLFEVYFLFPFFPFFSLALALSLSPFLPLPLSFPSFSGRRESWKRIQSSFRSVKEYR